MAKGAILRVAELPVGATESVVAEPLRLDIGCGKTKMDGWEGIDSIDFGQKHVFSVAEQDKLWYRQNHEFLMGDRDTPPVVPRYKAWPIADDSVSEVRSSHFVEHLDWDARVHFFNELYRVMKKGATAQIVTPNWSHSCYYGDPTHKAPLSQWYPLYLNKAWRDSNAPHDDSQYVKDAYKCDFDHVVAGSWDAAIEGRNAEHKQFAMNSYTNAWRDLIVTLTRK